MTGKRVQFDEATWQALDLLAHDRMMDFQEIADEAFRDLLVKYGRPTELRPALRLSAAEKCDGDPGVYDEGNRDESWPTRTPRIGKSEICVDLNN
jgi:hypothetical protein